MALLQRSTTAAQRMQVLECLQRETPDTRAKLAGDALCLGALEEWVLDLIEDRMSFHVLETLLKVCLPDAVIFYSCIFTFVAFLISYYTLQQIVFFALLISYYTLYTFVCFLVAEHPR